MVFWRRKNLLLASAEAEAASRDVSANESSILPVLVGEALCCRS